MNILFDRIKPDDNDLILLLNNDLWFGDNSSIDNMISLFKSDVGIVGSRILYPNSNLLQHAGIYFSKKYNYIPYNFRHGEKDDDKSRSNNEAEAVTAACMLTKAEYFRKVCTTNISGLNGFSEKYFWCFEDVDFNLSVKYNLNKKIMYCGKTKIFHEESASLKKNPVNKIMWNHNLKTFKNKWDGKFNKAD
jgi:GT2 family glycosyltransferase